jgi:2-polyprenyl-3-methyl-5-hydroxy-6-metoxy-1,4-benzoquinol methylase
MSHQRKGNSRPIYDAVIKDGRLVGEFEDLYASSKNPWNQSKEFSQQDSRRLLALEHARRLGDKDSRVSRTLEIGCGFGYLTQRLTEMGFSATGIDVAPTALKQARELHPGAAFFCRAFEDDGVLDTYEPDIVVCSEVTWYVLDHLDDFRRRLVNYASTREKPT